MSKRPGSWMLPIGLVLTLSSRAHADERSEGALTVPRLQDLAAECAGDAGCKAELCTGAPFDFCSLDDDEMAALALGADPQVTRWMAARARTFGAVRKKARDREVKDGDSYGMAKLSESSGARDLGVTSVATESSGGRTVEQQVALAVAGLARLIEDRMKQEGVGWALDSLGSDLCDNPTGNPGASTLLDGIDPTAKVAIQAELREHYLRSFCELAASPRLAGYGSGKATLQVVRNAVDNDARDLPGAVVGRGVAAAFGALTPPGAGLTDDQWRVDHARATAAAAGRRYSDAAAAAPGVRAWWLAGPAVPALNDTQRAALGSVGTAAGVPAARLTAAAEAQANLSAWDTYAATHLTDALAAPWIIDAIDRVHTGAGALLSATQTAEANAPNLPVAEKRGQLKALALSTRATAVAAQSWGADAQKVRASRPTPGAPVTCAPLDTMSGRWLRVKAVRAACAALGAGPATPAYVALYQGLEQEVASAYREAGPRASALQAAASELKTFADTLGPAAGATKTAAATADVAVHLASGSVQAFEKALADRAAVRASLREARSILSDPDAVAADPDLREAARSAVRRIVDGGDPLSALAELGRRLDGANRRPLGPDQRVLHSPEVQVFACAILLPGAHGGVLASVGGDSASAATLAAALTASPACWEIFGEGYTVDLARADALAWGNTPQLALDEPALARRLERLSTALRLYRELSMPGSRVVASWEHLVATQEELAAQLAAFSASNRELLEAIGEQGMEKQEIERLRQTVDAGRQLLLLQLGTMDDALDIASGVADLVRDGSHQVRGLCITRSGSDCDTAIDLSSLDRTHEALGELRKGLGLVKQVVSGKPAQAVASGLAELPDLCDELATDVQECRRAASSLATYGAGLAAVAEAESADEAAKALNHIANPPGGWRVKQTPGTTTVSLTAHPGIMGGLEWRFGPNGVVREAGGPNASDPLAPYGAAPTLALPVGVEFQVAPHWALYVPVLDPAAFLQYDVSEGAELPDPNLLTVLSPGVAVRYSFDRTPFGLLVGGLYRPSLRSSSGPAFASTGADAFQIVASATVDVTLLSLHSRKKEQK